MSISFFTLSYYNQLVIGGEDINDNTSISRRADFEFGSYQSNGSYDVNAHDPALISDSKLSNQSNKKSFVERISENSKKGHDKGGSEGKSF